MCFALTPLLALFIYLDIALWPLAVFSLLIGLVEKKQRKKLLYFTLAALLLTELSNLVLFYPALMSLAACYIFYSSHKNQKWLVLEIAKKLEPDLPTQAYNYCKLVNNIWASFLLLNTAISLYTALYCSKEDWALYNGLISYLLMASIFSLEFLYRKMIFQKTILLLIAISLSLLTPDSYALESCVWPELKTSSRSEFVQHRKIKGFSTNIKSSGEINFSQDSITWITKEPYKESVKISEMGFFVKESKKSFTDSKFKKIAAIILDIHSGFKHSRNKFKLECTSKNTFLAKPTSAHLSRFIQEVEIEVGSNNKVKQVSITDALGDISKLYLN